MRCKSPNLSYERLGILAQIQENFPLYPFALLALLLTFVEQREKHIPPRGHLRGEKFSSFPSPKKGEITSVKKDM